MDNWDKEFQNKSFGDVIYLQEIKFLYIGRCNKAQQYVLRDEEIEELAFFREKLPEEYSNTMKEFREQIKKKLPWWDYRKYF